MITLAISSVCDLLAVWRTVCLSVGRSCMPACLAVCLADRMPGLLACLFACSLAGWLAMLLVGGLAYDL